MSRPIQARSGRTNRIAAAMCALILSSSLNCTSIPGFTPQEASFTIFLSLIQFLEPPPNPLESQFTAPLFPTADGKFIVDAQTPIPLVAVLVAQLPATSAYAALGPDGRLYYTEKDSGRVRVLDPATGMILPDIILDLPVSNSGERGLKGIAFSSDGSQLFLTYDRSTTSADTGTDAEALDARISWFPFSGGAVTGDEMVVFTTPPFDPAAPSDKSGIGPCLVAPDGFLYVAHGDRDSSLTVLDLAPENASGRIFRFHQDGSTPTDNPNPESPGFATGFRHPTSMAVDPENGLFWITDVGNNVSDELNLLVGGRFYGWPAIQGLQNTQFEEDIADTLSLFNVQNPLIVFGFQKIDPRGLAVIRGGPYGPAMEGDLFIGQANMVPSPIHWLSIDENPVIERGIALTLPESAGRVRDITPGPDNRMYVFCQNEVYRIDPA